MPLLFFMKKTTVVYKISFKRDSFSPSNELQSVHGFIFESVSAAILATGQKGIITVHGRLSLPTSTV